MNCKPGDLAVVRCPIEPSNNGRFVVVTQLDPLLHSKWGPAWNYEGERIVSEGTALRAICDCWLKPIRDPGDDAVDESKAWLPPVPQTDKVSDRAPEKVS